MPPSAACACGCCSTTTASSGLDPIIAALDAHPNIEVRLYNPFANRGFKALGYVTDFKRAEPAHAQQVLHRGHPAHDRGRPQRRRRVLRRRRGDALRGPRRGGGGRVGARSRRGSSTSIWNSDSAYPADGIVGKPAPDGVAAMKARFAAVRSSPEAAEYIQAVGRRGWSNPCSRTSFDSIGRASKLLYDPPGKTLDKAKKEDLLLADLKHAIGKPAARAGHRLPVLRAGEDGHEESFRLPGEWDRAAHRHQLVRRDGRRRGPRRVLEAPQGSPAKRHPALRAQAERPGRRRSVGRPAEEGRRQLLREPAREDPSGRPKPRLRRIVQPGPALGEPEHRDGRHDRNPRSPPPSPTGWIGYRRPWRTKSS